MDCGRPGGRGAPGPEQRGRHDSPAGASISHVPGAFPVSQTHDFGAGAILASRRLALRWGWTGAALTLAGAIVVGVVLLLLSLPLKDDIAWLLYVADQTFQGRTLYRDLVEINPPLIVLVSMVPAWFGSMLGISAATAYVLLVALSLIGVALLVGRILRNCAPPAPHPGLVVAIVLAALFVLPGRDFGQRDHLVVALLLPWLALTAVRTSGGVPARGLCLAVGLLAAGAIGLKPHYAVLLVAVEAWALRRGVSWRRSEVLAVGAGLAANAIIVLGWFPAYLTEALPLALRHYGAGGVSPLRLVVNAREILLPLGILLVLAASGRRWREPPLVMVLLIASVAATCLYGVQFKGWPYHRVPADILLLLLCVVWLDRAITDERLRPSRAARTAMLGTALSLGLLGALALERQRVVADSAWRVADSAEAWLTGLIDRTHADSLMGFADELAPFFPVVNDTGVRWTSRYASMWALRGELAQGTASRWRDRVLPDIVDDFLAGSPALVIVDTSTRLDYLAHLVGDARFIAAWTHYRLIGEAHGLRAYWRG